MPNPEVSFDRNYCLSYDRPLSSKALRSIAGVVRRTVNKVRRDSVCYPRTQAFRNFLGRIWDNTFLLFQTNDEKNSEGRNRMHSLFRNLLKKPNKDNLAKAERIRKHNLGRKKQRARYIRDIGVIKTIVNRELNLLFTRKTNPIKQIVVEDLSARMKVHFWKEMEPTN